MQQQIERLGHQLLELTAQLVEKQTWLNQIKYPHTPHQFGSKGTDDGKHLGCDESEAFIADPSLIVEEKNDGTNVGIHFTSRGRIVLQCRGHEITEGMRPQYDLFKQ